MKKLLLLALIYYGSIECAIAAKKTWTILVYIAADNDLNPYAQPNIEQLMQIGSHDDLNILVYLAETKNGQKYGKLLLVNKNELVELYCNENADSGSQAICLQACIYTFTQFSADHHALIIWDHGAGSLNVPLAELLKSIAYDETYNSYLSDKDIFTIVQTVSTILHKKIDILGFDACLMATLELQALCAPYVSYYIASEENIALPGWNYAYAFDAITAVTTAEELATQIVYAFERFYESTNDWYTLSAVKLDDIDLLRHNVQMVAFCLSAFLHTSYAPVLTSIIQQATTRLNIDSFEYDEPNYIDLDHFYTNMLEYLQPIHDNRIMDSTINMLKQLLIEGRALIARLVVASVNGSLHAHARGISIYWPQKNIHSSYATLAWTDVYPQWYILLHSYLYNLKKINTN